MIEFDSFYTEFASPERASSVVVNEQYLFFKNYIETNSIIDAFNEFFLILNDKRQAVYANKSLLNFLKAKEIKDIIGSRPGEILACQHAVKSPCGCGTAMFCTKCGAVSAILNSLNGIDDIKECSVSKTDLETIDLRVWTRPFKVPIGNFVLFVFSDISDEKKKRSFRENILS